jgi:hypothetical protein
MIAAAAAQNLCCILLGGAHCTVHGVAAAQLLVLHVPNMGSVDSAFTMITVYNGVQIQAVAQVSSCLLFLSLLQENGDESGGADSSSMSSFQFLLALHALTAADPSLAVPAADTQRYVRLLAPYASNLGGIGAPAQGGRMSAGMLLS